MVSVDQVRCVSPLGSGESRRRNVVRRMMRSQNTGANRNAAAKCSNPSFTDSDWSTTGHPSASRIAHCTNDVPMPRRRRDGCTAPETGRRPLSGAPSATAAMSAPLVSRRQTPGPLAKARSTKAMSVAKGSPPSSSRQTLMRARTWSRSRIAVISGFSTWERRVGSSP
jgi:hypothetical protein